MPQKEHIRREYERRFHKVLNYIDENIDRRVSISELAGQASFSAFHFHRLFKAHFGESIGVYITRRRVEMGAIRLSAQPRLAIIDVAMDVGFGSPEAFSRAFAKRFGCAPSKWRNSFKNSNPDQVDSNLNQENERKPAYNGRMNEEIESNPIEIKLVEREPVQVLYLRYQGPFGESIGEFWRDEVHPWMVQNGLLGKPCYGVSLDDPKITDPDKCRYDACVEIENVSKVESLANSAEIPGGLFAVTEFFGKSSEIGKIWDEILRSWLPSSGYQVDSRPFIEYYSPNHQHEEETSKFACSICVPVTKLIK
jgi:AraC family transcriptional regulator